MVGEKEHLPEPIIDPNNDKLESKEKDKPRPPGFGTTPEKKTGQRGW